MAYNQNNSVTYEGSDHLAVNTGYSSVVSASKATTYKASKGFFLADGDIFITASDGTKTFVPQSADATVVYNISIIGWNSDGDANVTLLY